nr:hypothetical protein Man4p_00081 [Serratia proteamaculans]ULG19626.1 hypothetical protein S-prot-1p1_00042 [Serratia proteamaculans]
MHPVLGTMMPEICEAPHLSVFSFIHDCAPDLMSGMRSLHLLLRLQEATRGGRYGPRSLLPGACTPRPATGQADRGIPQPQALLRQGYAAKAA